ncbi:hypothetical protein BH11PSE12_BH11PSE12_33860 [soil metagenome]
MMMTWGWTCNYVWSMLVMYGNQWSLTPLITDYIDYIDYIDYEWIGNKANMIPKGLVRLWSTQQVSKKGSAEMPKWAIQPKR